VGVPCHLRPRLRQPLMKAHDPGIDRHSILDLQPGEDHLPEECTFSTTNDLFLRSSGLKFSPASAGSPSDFSDISSLAFFCLGLCAILGPTRPKITPPRLASVLT
jgi:hypothetical protein